MRAIPKLFVAALLVSAIGSSVWRGPSRFALLSPALATTSPCGTKPPPYPDQCIVDWKCNTVDLAWEEVWAAPGTACNDGNPCTAPDTCASGGACQGTPIVCTARGPCETAACVSGACSYTPLSPRPCPASTNACEAVCDGSSFTCQPN
jgi:hypothetical protein